MLIKPTTLGIYFLLSIVTQQVLAGFNVANQQVSRTISNQISKNLFAKMIPHLKVRNSSGHVKNMQLSTNGKYLTLSLEDNSIRVWDLEMGVQRPTIQLTSKASNSSIDVENDIIYVLSEAQIVGYNILTAEISSKLLLNDIQNISNFLLTADGKNTLLVNDSGLNLFHLQKKNVVWTQTDFEGEINRILVDKKGINWIGLVRSESLFSSTDLLKIGSINTGEIVHNLDNDGEKIVFFGFINSLEVLNVAYENGEIISWDISTGKKQSEAKLKDDNIVLMDISADGTLVYLKDDGELIVSDIRQKVTHSLTASEKKIDHLTLINDGKVVAMADETGMVFLVDSHSGQELVRLIETKQGWSVVDKKGRFDSSEKGMDNVSWETESYEVPLDSFSKSYYEPGLLASHLSDKKFINKSPANILSGIKQPPQSTIIIPDGNRMAAKAIIINVEVQGKGGGVEEVMLFHNGKVVVSEALINSKKETINKFIKKTVAFKLFPTVGENSFKVIATNKMGIEGHSDQVKVNFSGEKQKSILHVLTIGINQYKDSTLNLDYSVADASEIAKIFNKNKIPAFDEVTQVNLMDQKATKNEIISQLRKAGEYSQNDVMLLYLAGHGLAINGEWYFMPHETELRDNEIYYTQVGISATEIKDILSKIKIQRFMVMVDACYSGTGINTFRNLQYTQKHFARGLSKSVGVVVLAATRQGQEASESKDLGHGLFTYVTLDGMRGKADLQPKNRIVSAHEVVDFSTKNIPVFSKKYVKASQDPTAFKMGNDFSLLLREN